RADGRIRVPAQRREPNGALFESENDVTSGEAALHHVADALVDDQVGALHHAGEHVARRHVALVAVDADHPSIRLLGGLDDAEAVESRAVEDDVATAAVQILSDLDS